MFQYRLYVNYGDTGLLIDTNVLGLEKMIDDITCIPTDTAFTVEYYVQYDEITKKTLIQKDEQKYYVVTQYTPRWIKWTFDSIIVPSKKYKGYRVKYHSMELNNHFILSGGAADVYGCPYDVTLNICEGDGAYHMFASVADNAQYHNHKTYNNTGEAYVGPLDKYIDDSLNKQAEHEEREMVDTRSKLSTNCITRTEKKLREAHRNNATLPGDAQLQ